MPARWTSRRTPAALAAAATAAGPSALTRSYPPGGGLRSAVIDAQLVGGARRTAWPPSTGRLRQVLEAPTAGGGGGAGGSRCRVQAHPPRRHRRLDGNQGPVLAAGLTEGEAVGARPIRRSSMAILEAVDHVRHAGASTRQIALIVQLAPAVRARRREDVRLQVVWVEDVVTCIVSARRRHAAGAVPDRRARTSRPTTRCSRSSARASARATCARCTCRWRSSAPRPADVRAAQPAAHAGRAGAVRERQRHDGRTRSSSSSGSGRAASRSTSAARASTPEGDAGRATRISSKYLPARRLVRRFTWRSERDSSCRPARSRMSS